MTAPAVPPDSESFAVAVARSVGLPDTFLFTLLNEDDWSFLIKAHAFVEAILTRLLTTALGHEALADSIARLDTSGRHTSKCAFAAATGLLSRPAILFIEKLSELRNDVVHDVRNVGFSLPAWYASLDKNQRESFIQRMAYFATVAPSGAQPTESVARDMARGLVQTSPKHALWFNLSFFCLAMHFRTNAEGARVALEKTGASLLIASFPKRPAV